MARRYHISNTTSDSTMTLTQGGSAAIGYEYHRYAFQNISGTATALSTTVAASGSVGGNTLLPIPQGTISGGAAVNPNACFYVDSVTGSLPSTVTPTSFASSSPIIYIGG